MARAAMENLDGVERLMMSGLRATLVLEKDTARKVRAALMNELPGVQDIFCGPQTIVYLKHGATALEYDAIEDALESYEVPCKSVNRDDSKVL